jgi:hypothetical protein
MFCSTHYSDKIGQEFLTCFTIKYFCETLYELDDILSESRRLHSFYKYIRYHQNYYYNQYHEGRYSKFVIEDPNKSDDG